MRVWIFAVLIFIFALSLRLWNINMAGRWSDENALVHKGYTVIELIRRGDFGNHFWYNDAAGHPLLSTYFYGLASYLDFIRYDTSSNLTYYDDNSFSPWKGGAIFQYDLFFSRIVSVIISSLAVVLVFIIGYYYFSLFTGIVASLILAMLPHFLGYSQFVTYESWVVTFFTISTFSYYLFLEKRSKFLLILTGIFTGLTLQVKESTVIIFALYITTFYVWKKITGKNIFFWHLVIITFIAVITFIAIWPNLLFHIPDYYKFINELWFHDRGNIPELLFGKHMGAHFFYYPIAFLITTPILILILNFIGIKASYSKKKNWIFPALIIWFLVPFIMMLFHHRQNMVRYIIEIYTPVALLSAIGFEHLIKLFTNNKIIKYFAIIPLFAYLFYILLNLTPYYVEYYNELVGGTKNVYENKLFFLGWFGEGLKKSGEYVAENSRKGSNVGLKIQPYHSALYKIPSLHYEEFTPKHRYDYVIVNYYAVVRLEFDEKILEKDYKIVYAEKAADIDLVHVYKHK